MSTKHLVSVIIPFFNAEKFLSQAINSVLAQTYENWELLLIDDGSKDSSTQTAKEYAGRNRERIFYIEHASPQNRGVCASRNVGISRANGHYVAFLDSDDVWLPDKLREQVDILDRIPEASVVYGPALYWYSWTGRPADRAFDILQELNVESNQLYRPPALLLKIDPLGKGPSVCPSDILIRKEALERSGGFEESFTGVHQAYEDQAFGMKLFFKENVFVSGTCWTKYRRHSDSCLSVLRRSGREREAHLFFLRWVEEFLSKNGQKGTEAWQALQRSFWPYQHPVLSRIRKIFVAPLRLIKWGAFKILGPETYHRYRRKLKTASRPS